MNSTAAVQTSSLPLVEFVLECNVLGAFSAVEVGESAASGGRSVAQVDCPSVVGVAGEKAVETDFGATSPEEQCQPCFGYWVGIKDGA